MIRSRIACGVAALLLGGCASSPPLRYYVLSEVPPAAQSNTSTSSSDAVQVTRVVLPGEIDRSEIVQRVDANRLRIAEDDRWAAPLEDMIRRVLAADLRQRAGAHAAQVSVQIESFTADVSCGVELRASWEWREPGASVPSPRRRAEIQIPAGAQACPMSDVPARMSAALSQLAQHMLEEVDAVSR